MKKILIIFSFLTIFFGAACGLLKPSKTLDRIEVTTQIADTSYEIGELIDLTGGKLTIYYSDGTSNEVDITQSMISNFDSSTSGNKEILVTYTEGNVTKTTTFTVVIEDNTPKIIDYIYVASNPIKSKYVEGEEFDPSGMVIEVCYTDETFHEVTNYTLDKTILALGDRVITATYEGFTTPIYVSVVEKELVSISVDTMPLKTSYIEGESFVKIGMVIMANYNNNTSQQITNYTIDKTVLSISDNYVTVTYQQKTVKVEVTVVAKTAIRLVVLEGPTKTSYNVGEYFDPTGLKVAVEYDNGDIEELDSTEYQIHSSSALEDGTEKIKIIYGTFEVNVDIEVLTVSELYQKAVVETGFAYWYNQNQIQYDQSKGRRQIEIAPEEATEYREIYLDCSSYVYSVYYHTFDYELPAQNTAGLETYAKENVGKSEDVLYYGRVEDYPTNEDKQAILTEIRNALQPGDLINYRHGKTSGSAGHVMLYVGNDTFLHSTGSSYSYTTNPSSSTDKATADEARIGSVQLLAASEVFENVDSRRYLFHKASDDSTWSFALLRPLNNDGLELTESAKARLENPGLNIEKTSNPAHMSTVIEGDEITYTFNIKNESDKSLIDIEVKDTISVSAIYVDNSISDGGVVDFDKISWNISEIKPRETIKLSYKVKIKNGIEGTKIDSSSGNVEGIKTNTLWHVVGGINSTQLSILDTALTSSIGSTYTDSLEYVKNIYSSVLDINITSHTSITDVFDDVINRTTSFSRTDTELSKILVPNMYGGVDFHTKAPTLTRIRYVRPNYLECGDIILTYNSYNSTSNAYIYQNSSTILGINNGEVVKTYSTNANVSTFLMQLIAYERFAILRPSLDSNGVVVSEDSQEYTIPQLIEFGATNDMVSIEGVVVGMIQDTNGNKAPSGILIMDEQSQKMIAVHNLDGSYPNFVTSDGSTIIKKGDKLLLKNVKYKKTSTNFVSSGAISNERKMVELIDGTSKLTVISSNNSVDLTRDITIIANESDMISKMASVNMYEVIKFEASSENTLYVGQSNDDASKANAYIHYRQDAKKLEDSKYSITVWGATSSTKDRGICVSKYDESISYFKLGETVATAKASSYTSGSIYAVIIHVTSTYCVILPVNSITLASQ